MSDREGKGEREGVREREREREWARGKKRENFVKYNSPFSAIIMSYFECEQSPSHLLSVAQNFHQHI